LFDRNIEKHHIKMKSYVAIQKKLLVVIYSLFKNNQVFDENYYNNNITGEVDSEYPSRLSFEEAVQDEQKNSHTLKRGYTRCTTVEVSSFAPSRLLQK